MKFNIELGIYFEIKDSYFYGGEGSVGYSCVSVGFDHIDYDGDNLFNKKELMEKYIAEQTENIAEFSKVPVECVRVISKEEYDENMDDDR